MFDFAKAISEAQSDLLNKNLFLILLGSSGNGKSYALGTFGVKTLYLYTQGESHGPKSASSLGGKNIIPVCIDREGDSPLAADEALKRLHAILDDVAGIKKAGVKAIALDGATELETLIRSTSKFKTACLANGKHNSFEEGPATLAQFREVLNKLKRLQREAAVHVCMTCILDVKEYGGDGEIVDSTPKLHGFAVATGLVQQFDDVMVIGRMQRKDKIAYRLQLLAGVTKSTTDFTTKEVKKTYNFSPRLTGTDIIGLGATLDADLGKLASLKAGEKV
jgi:hypothetical protein